MISSVATAPSTTHGPGQEPTACGSVQEEALVNEAVVVLIRAEET